MRADCLCGNCGVIEFYSFSPATSVSQLEAYKKDAKADNYRFAIATINAAQRDNLHPKLIKAGFELVKYGINSNSDNKIYIYICDLGYKTFKQRRKSEWM